DDVLLYPDEGRRSALATLHTLRQQMEKRDGRPNVALADYVAPVDSGILDYVGAFAVTAGHGADTIAKRLEAAGDDYGSIMVKALADRPAQAVAERMHERGRRRLRGDAPGEPRANEPLIRQAHQGVRPAP